MYCLQLFMFSLNVLTMFNKLKLRNLYEWFLYFFLSQSYTHIFDGKNNLLGKHCDRNSNKIGSDLKLKVIINCIEIFLKIKLNSCYFTLCTKWLLKKPWKNNRYLLVSINSKTLVFCCLSKSLKISLQTKLSL